MVIQKNWQDLIKPNKLDVRLGSDRRRTATMTAPLPRSKLRVADIATITFGALRRRPARTALSVAGITVGIAAIVSVLGITEASNAAVVARIDALGTDLLAVEAGQSLGGDPSQLAPTAPQAIGHLTGVVSVSGTAGLPSLVQYVSDGVVLIF